MPTLLLADDSITIQKIVGITFANEDIELVTVDNGDDALVRAKEIKPDIVLADVSMPGLNGYELCAAIKADPDLSRTPVMLLTGTFQSFDEERARDAGIDAHIAKPFEAEALVNQVLQLLEGGPITAEESPPIIEPPEFVEALKPPDLPELDPEASGEFSFDDLDFAGPPEMAAERTQIFRAAPESGSEDEMPPLEADVLNLDARESSGDPVAGPESFTHSDLKNDGLGERLLTEASFADPLDDLPDPVLIPEDGEILLENEPLPSHAPEALEGPMPSDPDPLGESTALGDPPATEDPLFPARSERILSAELGEPDALDLDPTPAPAPAAELSGLDADDPPVLEPAMLEPDAVTPAGPPQAEPSPPASGELPVALQSETLHQVLEKLAWEAFGPLSEQLVHEIVEKVEAVAWEVIPQIAERLIQAEIDRMKAHTSE